MKKSLILDCLERDFGDLPFPGGGSLYIQSFFSSSRWFLKVVVCGQFLELESLRMVF